MESSAAADAFAAQSRPVVINWLTGRLFENLPALYGARPARL